MTKGLELGLYTLGDHIANPHTKQLISAKERIQNIIEMGQLAEQAGLDIFQVGESHETNFVSQAHLIILAAIAQATSKIRLASSATVIGTLDPVRVYEDSATIDLLSDGRMELVCGRSARTGVYDTLGFNLKEYEALFNEKYQLLKLINERSIVQWQGHYRAPINNVPILPRSEQEKGLTIWRAIGGSLESAKLAGQAGDNVYVTNFNGRYQEVATLIGEYRQAAQLEGISEQDTKVSLAGYLFTREDTQAAIEMYYPYLNQGTMCAYRQPFEQAIIQQASSKDSIINIGSPEWLIEKLIMQYETLGIQRFVGQIDFGGMPHDEVKRTIDILGEKVIPAVKKYTTK